jgi:hypothetical protein
MPPDDRRVPRNTKLGAVDFVLSEWGKWMRNANKVLGWRTQSLVQKIQKERDGASQQTAPTEIPDGIMRTDAAIATLTDIRQKVIKIEYIHCRELAKEIKRRRLGMSEYKWNSSLKEAKQMIARELGLTVPD